MDNISSTIKARFDHQASRQILKEKYQAKMIFTEQGGMWRAGPELIILLNSINQDELILLDLYDSPILVNKQKLLTIAIERWQEQLNAWKVELAETNKQR
jgi:hypothetical protein